MTFCPSSSHFVLWYLEKYWTATVTVQYSNSRWHTLRRVRHLDVPKLAKMSCAQKEVVIRCQGRSSWVIQYCHGKRWKWITLRSSCLLLKPAQGQIYKPVLCLHRGTHVLSLHKGKKDPDDAFRMSLTPSGWKHTYIQCNEVLTWHSSLSGWMVITVICFTNLLNSWTLKF